MLRGHVDRLLMRKLMDFVDVWHDCDRACRRRKGCASPTVECFDDNTERVRLIFGKAADWRRLDGPRDLDEIVEPIESIDDLFD